jgi:copper chaperone CopZ
LIPDKPLIIGIFDFLYILLNESMIGTMRTTLLLAMLLVLAVACKPKGSSDQTVASNAAVTVEMGVTGMHCMGCVETVRSSIAQLEGIDTVLVSLDSARATVTFHPQQVDTLKIRDAVELNGYKISGIKTVQ